MRVVEDGLLRWYVAKDICDALGITNSRDAVSRLDDDEKRMVICDTPGGKQKVNAVSPAGVYRLLFTSNKEYARKYQRWVIHEILPTIQRDGHYDIAMDSISQRIDDLVDILKESGIIKPFVNPRYTFDNLKMRFKAACPGLRARDFYDALGEWYGVNVPFSNTINITVKEWILLNIPMESMLELINGIESKTIIRSRSGRWVSLNGVFGNQTEWPRIKKEFNNRCAYCGASTTLVPEHIIAQSALSESQPARVDLVENIVPACPSCNTSKGTSKFKDWYKKQPFFNKQRHTKIQNHWKKYHVE